VSAIVVEGLRKSYGAVEAVRDISFTVERGEVFGLLGPNGAGKTTTVEILEGYRKRDAGRVEVLGEDPANGSRSLKQRVGLVLQECAVPPALTVREVVELNRCYYPSPRPLDEVIELVGLGEKSNARVKALSGGQQRRLDLALALIGDPELIFLDEPTTGFDPSARRNAWEIVRSMRRLGKTVVLTTHYMDEAQNLADRICLIAAGRVLRMGTPDSLRAEQSVTRIRFSLSAGLDMARAPVSAELEADGIVPVMTETPTRVLHELTTWALAEGAELGGLEVSRPSLEDVYLTLTTP
jgi:ABC-2 type transport system ATP-binding protein